MNYHWAPIILYELFLEIERSESTTYHVCLNFCDPLLIHIPFHEFHELSKMKALDDTLYRIERLKYTEYHELLFVLNRQNVCYQVKPKNIHKHIVYVDLPVTSQNHKIYVFLLVVFDVQL